MFIISRCLQFSVLCHNRMFIVQIYENNHLQVFGILYIYGPSLWINMINVCIFEGKQFSQRLIFVVSSVLLIFSRYMNYVASSWYLFMRFKDVMKFGKYKSLTNINEFTVDWIYNI